MTDLLRRAWDALDAFKQAYPENWHDEDEQVLKDLMSADFTAQQPEPLAEEKVIALLPDAVRLPQGWRNFARAIEAAHGIGGDK